MNKPANRRMIIDLVSRIEGHLRIEAEIIGHFVRRADLDIPENVSS